MVIKLPIGDFELGNWALVFLGLWIVDLNPPSQIPDHQLFILSPNGDFHF